MIYKTVGTGGNYADWGTAWNAIAALNPLHDDYEIRQISNVVNSTSMTAGYGINPNGHTVKFYCAEVDSHQGCVNKGFITTVNTPLTFHPNAFVACSGTILIEGLNCVSNVVGNYVMSIGGGDNTSFDSNVICNNVIIKGKTVGIPSGDNIYSTGIYVGYGQWTTCKLTNCKIWNCASAGVRVGLEIYGSGKIAKFYIENVTIWDCAKTLYVAPQLVAGFWVTRVATGQLYCSNVVCCTQHKDYRIDYDPVYLKYCADSDNTCPDTFGGNNKHNVNASIEFDSLVSTSNRFLYLSKGHLDASGGPDKSKGQAPLDVNFTSDITYEFPTNSVLYKSGLIPSLNTKDITGTNYGDYGYYPIGCHNVEVSY